MKVPNNWSEISYEQYLEIIEIFNNDELGLFEKNIELLALFNDTSTDDEIFEDMDVDEMFNIISNMKWLKQKPIGQLKQKLSDLTLKNLNNIKIGEYITLDNLINDEQNLVKNIPIICAVLYKKNNLNSFNNLIEEPFDYDLNERSKLFMYEKITTLIPVVDYFVQFKDNFIKQYQPLFQEPDELNEDELKELSPEEINDMKKEIENEKIKQKFSWHYFIYQLCNGDLTKYEEVTNLSLVLAFNMLSMKKVFNLE